MCGIAGELRYDGNAADGEAVRRMLPCLETRGPEARVSGRAGRWRSAIAA